jgi:hypothetical protein
VSGVPSNWAFPDVLTSLPIQPARSESPEEAKPSASFESRSFVRTCCSTPENVASWTAKSEDSIGLSGSWFFIWTVSILRNVSKSELNALVRVCGACVCCAREIPVPVVSMKLS